jgi:GrpB-like predicted nucleotidyltransferase (UPF0157 family)
MIMPVAIALELEQYDPAWAENAQQEGARLATEIGEVVIAVHHIGSTAIPGICAKPILDLIPVVLSIPKFEKSRSIVAGLGYSCWGEYGIPGRRYCTLDDPLTGRRMVQLHRFEQGSLQIVRHLAFRDYLRSHPDVAREYDAEKDRCRDLHSLDSHAYSNCKDAWIRRIEAQALSGAAFVNRT